MALSSFEITGDLFRGQTRPGPEFPRNPVHVGSEKEILGSYGFHLRWVEPRSHLYTQIVYTGSRPRKLGFYFQK